MAHIVILGASTGGNIFTNDTQERKLP